MTFVCSSWGGSFLTFGAFRAHFYFSLPRLMSLFLLCLPLVLYCAPTHDSPEQVVQKLYKSVIDNSFDSFVSCFSVKGIDQKHLKRVPELLREMFDATHMKLQCRGGLQSVETTVLKRETNVAVVSVRVTSVDGWADTGTTNLIREEDGWKIDLSELLVLRF